MKHMRTVTIVVAIVVFFTSCIGPFSQSDQDANEKTSGTGSLSVSVSHRTVGASTVQPGFGDEIVRYEVSGTGPDGNQLGPQEIASTDTVAGLLIGSWTISVEAHNADGQVVARGQQAVEIVAGGNSVSIDLEFTQIGTGSFEISLSWPDGTDITMLEQKVNDISYDPLDIDGQTSVRFTGDIESGNHIAVFHLRAGDLLRATIVEAIQVFDNQLSVADIHITADDLSAPPPAPTALQAELQADETVLVSWDASEIYTETGFVVERDESADFTNPTELSVTDSNVTTYTDEAQTGDGAHYRVASRNAFGRSDWAVTEVGPGATPEEPFLLVETFDDGDFTSNPVWTYEGDGSTSPSVIDVDGNNKLKVLRGSSSSASLNVFTDLSLSGDHFRVEYSAEGVTSDSTQRGWFFLNDSNGDRLYRFFPDNWNDVLTVTMYEYDQFGDETPTVFVDVPYNEDSSFHTFALEKDGDLFTVYVDGVEFHATTHAISNSRFDSIAEFQISSHGSGPSSGLYWDDFRIETIGTDSEPGGFRALTLQNATINGSTVSDRAPEFTVVAGEDIRGTYSVLFETDYASSNVFPLAATPNWGSKTTDFWLDHSDMSSGQIYTGTIDLMAPDNAGTYYIIIATHSEYTASEIMSATRWSVDSVVWDDGNDLYDLSATDIQTGTQNGSLVHPALTTSGFSDSSYGLTAIKLIVEENTGTTAYAIGDPGPADGLIFYDKGSYSDGWRYLEAAPAQTEWVGVPWGGRGTLVNATATAIGSGKTNTDTIVATLSGTDYAAELCDSLVSGDADDWFLPSEAEMDEMLDVLFVDPDHNTGGFSAYVYWTSSEADDVYASALYPQTSMGRYRVPFKDTTDYDPTVDYWDMAVRAARRF